LTTYWTLSSISFGLQKYILESGSESSNNSRNLCICAYYMKLAYISRSRFSMGINLMNLSLSEEFTSVVNTLTILCCRGGFIPGLIVKFSLNVDDIYIWTTVPEKWFLICCILFEIYKFWQECYYL
jgi:hypothetical protein